MKRNADRYLTREDAERLEALLEQYRSVETAAALERKLDRARVVSSETIAPSVITMHSRLRYRDTETGAVHEVTLVYPSEANIAWKRVSVLAPVGVALLGVSVGQSIEFRVPDGRTKRIEVIDVVHQPEAAAKASPPRRPRLHSAA